MNEKEAARLLEDAELVPCLRSSLVEAKRVRERLLENEIAAMLGCEDPCAKGGCTPSVQLLVREEDFPRAIALLQAQWVSLAIQEGSFDPSALAANHAAADLEPEGEPPCPACGTAAPLVDGACSECGLQLE